MLNKRMLFILEYLMENQGKGLLKNMVNIIQMSERTIRYDIDKINEFLLEKNIGKINKLSKGIVVLENPENVKEYLLENFHEIFFLEYRDIFLTISILFSGKINISHICETFDLSRTTIKNDLKGIKKKLEEYNLKLEINTHKGLVLIGKEEDVRRMQLNILNKYFDFEDTHSLEVKYISKLIEKNFKGIDFKSVSKFIDYVTENMEKIISDEAYLILKNYILIMVRRIQQNKILKTSLNENFLMTTEEYNAVLKAIPILEAVYNLKINNYEILKLTDYFLGSHSYNTKMSFYKNWIEIETIIKKIIDEFSEQIQLDLSKDEFLFDGLLNHIKPTIHRIRNKIELKNSIYSEVISEYPKLFTLTKKVFSNLEEFIGKEFSKEELAFLVIHFKGAIDRNAYQKKETRNILLVCGEGLGTSKLISQQLKENYDVNILNTIPLNQLTKTIKKLDKTIDLIVTTLKIKDIETDIPVILVKPILNNEELKRLDRYNLPKYNKKVLLSNILKSLKKGATITDEKLVIKELKKHLGNKLIDDMEEEAPNLLNLLPIENINLNIGINSWEEAIKFSGNILYKNGYVEKEYSFEMVNIIKKHGPYMIVAKNLAIPHTNKKYVRKTGMSLLTLNNPVYFPGNIPVTTILAFSSLHGKEHFNALRSFIDMVKSYEFIGKVEKLNSSKKVIEIIKKYEFLMNLGKQK
jgi:transcriptional antiterminator/mannitol/fructose-specific phosphotransferase system IIA component (Ntr-type)